MYYDYFQDSYTEAKAKVNRTLLAFAVFAVVYIAATFVCSFLAGMLMAAVGDIPYIEWVLSVVPLYFIAFPVLLVLLPKKAEAMGQKKCMPLWAILLTIPVCYTLIMLGNYIGIAVNGVLSRIPIFDPNQEIVSDMLQGGDLLIAAIVTVIIAPIMEEIVFRKLLIDRLRIGGEWFAVIVSGVLFGLFHGNFTQFFYAALLGIVLGVVYAKTGNVLYTIFLHMFINFFSGILPTVITADIEELLNTLSAPGYSPAMSELAPLFAFLQYTFAMFALVICGCVIIVTFWRSDARRLERSPYSLGESVRLALGSPWLYLTVAACAVIFLLALL